MIPKLIGFNEKDIPVLNEVLRSLDKRISTIDGTVPTAEVDETKFSHKIPIVIGGVQYYIMLTAS